jgi:beta-lactam-binding protein with PASTA domain
MALLDGKYEILGEQSVGAGVSRMRATTPDGEAIRIEWFDPDPADDANFERYRRLLKRLTRDGRALVLDVVERPGARYVAWRLPLGTARTTRDDDLERTIAAAGFDPRGADVRTIDARAMLVALPFRPGPAAAAAERTRPQRTLRLPTHVATLIASGTLMLAAGLFTLLAFARYANDHAVVLPDLLGRPYPEVAATLHALGFDVVPVTVIDDQATPLAVVSLDPRPGVTLRPGRSVRVGVAYTAGAIDPTTVPRLIGISEAAAIEILAQAGLTIGKRIAIHLDAPQGIVLSQAPIPGTRIGRGAAVEVVLSLGPRSAATFVPDLTGRSEEEARALARLAGLRDAQVIVERIDTDAYPPGTVVTQSLPAYREVALGDAVLRLLIASAASMPADALPLLGGLSETEARRLAAGFAIEVETISERPLPDGVIAQSLPPGALPGDGTLRLLINERPLRIPVPNAIVTIREPQERTFAYGWYVEPGIRDVVAEVEAWLGSGARIVVTRAITRGGERVEGVWASTYPGIVEFVLTLNGEAYGAPQRAHGTLRSP